jgi:hypothetical protein
MTVYSEDFEGRKAGIIPELFSVLTNPTSPQAWMQLALHAWDLGELESRATEWISKLGTYYDSCLSDLQKFRTTPPETIVNIAQGWAKETFKQQVAFERDIMKWAKEKPMSTSISRLGWNLSQYLRFWDTYKAIAINLPSEYGLIIPAERYWKKFYARGRPGFRDAFIMWRKGLADENLPYYILLEDAGMPEDLARNYLQHAFYDPSPSELWRMARTIALPETYVDKKLTNAGLDDTDKEVYKKAILKEVIKEELRTVNTLLLDEYELGTLGQDEFAKWLKAWELSDDEVSLMLLAGDIRKSKFVLKLKRDAQIYLFRKQVIDAKTLEQRLTDLGIDASVANAIVENECARIGVEWTGV